MSEYEIDNWDYDKVVSRGDEFFKRNSGKIGTDIEGEVKIDFPTKAELALAFGFITVQDMFSYITHERKYSKYLVAQLTRMESVVEKVMLSCPKYSKACEVWLNNLWSDGIWRRKTDADVGNETVTKVVELSKESLEGMIKMFNDRYLGIDSKASDNGRLQ